jgi:hypothetical protein
MLKKLAALLLLVSVAPGLAFAHSVALTCTDTDTTVTGFHFYRSSTSGGPYSQIDTTNITTCAFTDILVSAGQTWYYVAKAHNSGGTLSAKSNEAKAVIPTVTAPSNLTAVPK